MKKLTLIIAGLLLAGLTVSYAGSKCCPASKAKAAAAKAAKAECDLDSKKGFMNEEMVKALKLSDEQKAELAKIQKECADKKDCKVTQKKALKKMKKLLTADQLAICEQICKDSGGKCPLPKGEKVKS